MNNAPALSNPAFDPLLARRRLRRTRRERNTLADDLVPAVLTVAQARSDEGGRPLSHPVPICRGCACRTRTSTRTIPKGCSATGTSVGAGPRKRRRSCRGRQRSCSRSTRPRPRIRSSSLLTTTAYPISGKSQAIGGGELQLAAAWPRRFRRSRSSGPPRRESARWARPRPGPHLDGRGGAGWRAGHHRVRPSTLPRWPGSRHRRKTWSGGDWNAKTWAGTLGAGTLSGDLGGQDLERRIPGAPRPGPPASSRATLGRPRPGAPRPGAATPGVEPRGAAACGPRNPGADRVR